MNASTPSFPADNLLPTLQRLCDTIDAPSSVRKPPVPQPGCFTGDPETLDSPEAARRRLSDWIGSGEGVTGWILTTEALHLFPGTSTLPDEIPLHAELHREEGDQSLNLRHTPQGWTWEELTVSPENSTSDAFLEKSGEEITANSMDTNTVMIAPDPADPDRTLIPGKRHACYQVEWRLTEAPGNSSPATFRPARSRFLGWK